ncbi:hypothetical protein M2273_004279 [Mucilaginibacter lappiensis]
MRRIIQLRQHLGDLKAYNCQLKFKTKPYMKKVIPAILLCLFLFACKKDKNSPANASIVGTWTVNSSTMSFYDKNDKLLGSDDTGDDKVTFTSKGVVTGTSTDDMSGTTTYVVSSSGGKNYLKITTDDGQQNILSITYEIITLTDHNLEFKSDNLYDPDVPDTYNGVYYTKVILDLKASR